MIFGFIQTTKDFEGLTMVEIRFDILLKCNVFTTHL